LLARVAAYGLIIFVLIGVGGLPEAARGQGKPRRKVIRLEAIKVEGRIQKPQAFYILQRSNLNFEGLELKQSFIPKIIQSVEKEPF
jgi:hypothetical protein